MARTAFARKCLCCNESFLPERRNLRHQKFCSKPTCRQASKRASQRRWVSQPKNQSYFRGPENVARVREWRAAHPGYWRRSSKRSSPALQDVCPPQPPPLQPLDPLPIRDSSTHALQDICQAQLPLLLGLMHQLLDSPLQEDILPFARRLIAKGQDLLDRPSQRRSAAACTPVHEPQTSPPT